MMEEEMRRRRDVFTTKILNLPKNLETIPKNPEVFFCFEKLLEGQKLSFKFYVRSYIQTFVSFQMYYQNPAP